MKWDEGIYLGSDWRTGEAVIGIEDGARKAGTVKRVGAHRRWDGERLASVQGLPWKLKPAGDDKKRM